MAVRGKTAFRFPHDKYEDTSAMYENMRYLQEYLRGIKANVTHAYDIIVKPSNSAAEQDGDINLTGSGDDALIQAAIDDGAQSFFFLDGDVSLSNDLTSTSDMLFAGSGPGVTTITSSDSNGFFSSEYKIIVSFLDFTFDGNSAAGRFIQTLTSEAHWVALCFNVEILNCTTYGIQLIQGGASDRAAENIIHGCTIDNCGTGVYVGSVGLISNTTITDGSIGIDVVNVGEASVIGNRITGNSGKSVQNGNIALVVGNVVDSNGTDAPEGTVVGLNLVGGSMGAVSMDLDDLGDVVISSVADNEVLAYDNGSGNWINQTAAEAGLSDSSHTHTQDPTDEEIEDLVGAMFSGNTETLITVTYQDSDGTIDLVVDNDLSNYSNSSSGFLNTTTHDALDHTTAAASIALDDLGDVVVSSVADNEVLAFDSGGNWINQTAAEAGLSATGHTHTESEITDLDHYDSTDFATDFAASDLDDLGTKEADDLDATGITDGYVLTADGAGASAWEASAGGSGTDDDAIHDNVSGEIAAITQKSTPTSSDHLLIEDAAASNAKKRATIGNVQAILDHGSIAGLTDDDHTQYTRKDTLTTTGDIYYASSANTPARLAKGTSGQFLKQGASIPSWANLTVADLANSNAWTTWSPSYANLTIGNGTVVARYVQIGKMVHARFRLDWGSTTSLSGAPTVSIPVTASSSAYDGNFHVNVAFFKEAGGVNVFGRVALASTTTASVVAANAAGTYVVSSSVSATVPFTWGTSDVLSFQITYEAA